MGNAATHAKHTAKTGTRPLGGSAGSGGRKDSRQNQRQGRADQKRKRNWNASTYHGPPEKDVEPNCVHEADGCEQSDAANGQTTTPKRARRPDSKSDEAQPRDEEECLCECLRN